LVLPAEDDITLTELVDGLLLTASAAVTEATTKTTTINQHSQE